MLLRNQDLTIHSADELVAEYKKVAPERTQKYDFCHVEGHGSDSDAGDDDGMEEEEQEQEHDEQFPVGCVVWAARYRKQIPAIICDLDDIPAGRKRALKTSKSDMCYVQYLGTDNFSVVPKTKLLKLGANPIDMRLKENTTSEIYQMALEMSV